MRARGDSQVHAEGQTLEFEPISDLAPGEAATWEVAVRGVEAGKGEFRLNVESDSGSFRSGEPTTAY